VARKSGDRAASTRASNELETPHFKAGRRAGCSQSKDDYKDISLRVPSTCPGWGQASDGDGRQGDNEAL
jgi:hypothetical protein